MAAAMLRVETTVGLPPEKVWELWTDPDHITNWYFASPDWHAPRASSDLRVGGSFVTRMEARDGSFGFDFGGVYLHVEKPRRLECRLGDGRSLVISFSALDSGTRIVEDFEAEQMNNPERQREGWQAILDNFKRYAEAN